MGSWVRWLTSAMLWLASGTALAAAGGQASDGLQYVALKPAFIASFGGPGASHFLKADLAVRVGSGEAAALVAYHGPQLRHEMVMLLSEQTVESLSSMEGKEALRQQALAAIQAVFEREEGEPVIEDLLFNGLVVQR